MTVSVGRALSGKEEKMKKTGKIVAAVLVLMLALTASGLSVFASSDDNSLASLGITTEGAVVTPEFAYDTWNYEVTVPAGTVQLELEPVPSSSAAVIADISGTTLGEDGTTTVTITVQAGNGDQFPYTLNVKTSGEAPVQPEEQQPPQTEAPQTEAPQTEAPTEPQTEDSRFVKVEKNTILQAENTITKLKTDITKYRDTVSKYTKIMYGLIAVAVVLLFIVINLILRKRDLKLELNEYRSLGYSSGKKAQKGKSAPAQQGGYPSAVAPPRTGMPGADRGAAQPYAPAQRMDQGTDAAAGNNGNAAPRRAPSDPHYTTGGALDVRPMTSQKKSRRLPEYQQEVERTQAKEAALASDKAGQNKGVKAAPPQPVQPGAEKNGKPESASAPQAAQVEIDMIDL